MSNYFILTLDTTPPQIEIIAPTYTVADIENEIFVLANEALSKNHEIYIIDALGIRHDLTFSKRGDYFYGLVRFNMCAFGIATIYARVCDLVLNQSSTAIKTIEIISASVLTIEQKLSIFSQNADKSPYNQDANMVLFDIDYSDMPRAFSTKWLIMSLYTEFSTRKILGGGIIVTVQKGNAIKLTTTFYGFDSEAADPDEVKIKFYDSRYKMIQEVLLGVANKVDIGQYEYFHVPQDEGKFYYEWSGTIGGLPSIKRLPMIVVFADEEV